MPRLLFEKTGNAVWISHLDLMRVFQRAFKRANLKLKHTQGFNPRPTVSIALPLSVGVESKCELLDFDLDEMDISCELIMDKLNEALISGVRVIDCYETGRKLRDLSLLRCIITLEYDNGIPKGAQLQINNLFSQESVVVPKRTKDGIKDQNLIPMIRHLELDERDENILQMEALICCQNPTLNPMQMISAISIHLPDMKPDFAKCCRLEVYDVNEVIFR